MGGASGSLECSRIEDTLRFSLPLRLAQARPRDAENQTERELVSPLVAVGLGGAWRAILSDLWSILHQDDRILAVRKPAGIHVHRSEYDRDEPALVERIEAETGLKLFPVHRLDRPTSGALVFALDHEAASHLGAAFRSRDVDKTYWAVVRGWMPATHATFDVQFDVKLPEKTDAETWFQPLERFEAPWPRRGFSTFRFGLVEAKPVTGRRHQIRQHCDDLRHPIVGDTVWGDTGMNGWMGTELAVRGLSLGGLHLWCRELEFPHPDGGRLTVKAALSPDESERLQFYRQFLTEP